MKPFQLFYITAAIVGLASHVLAVPVDISTATEDLEEAVSRENEETENTKTPTTSSPKTESEEDLQTSNSQQATTYVIPEHHSSVGNNGHFDPSIYAGYLTPESFQQYLAQFAGAFGPYGYPGYGPAPSPVYPAPYAVQTGYDGFLVPQPPTNLPHSSTGGNFITALSHALPTVMDSTLVRVIITAFGALLMVLFGGAITTAICNLTPICDISFRAAAYLRGNGAGNVGMLVEEMTPERVRRASEIVKSAIRKYNEMQRMMGEEKNVYE